MSPLDRRSLLKYGALGGALALARPAFPVAAEEGEGAGAGATNAAPFELNEATVAELDKRMAAGELTSQRIVQLYLGRIKELDQGDKGVHSVIELNPDAEEIAAALDRERQAKGARGPLHGIPIIIKDNLDTGDKMMTTAGSLALAGKSAPRDSTVAAKLREAGMVILGKANLSEWANFRSTHSTSGWSGRGRQTHNPYALDRNPCGSSSGSGAAASANFCTLAIGTETDGSVVCPSSMNGVVGIKPTVGLVSRAGIVPISHSQDTAGAMARSVRDAAHLLSAIAGSDPRDTSTKQADKFKHDDYTKFLEEGGLKGARIGVARQFFGFDSRVDEIMERVLETLRKGGATLIDPVKLPHLREIGKPEFAAMLYEFKADINKYLAGRGDTVKCHTLKDLIAFNKAHATEEMPYFGQELFVQAEKKGPLSDAAYKKAITDCQKFARAEGIDLVMGKHKLDALVAPTAGPAWMTDLVNGDHDTGGSSTPAAVAGYPSITVPAGFIYGLPIGASFFGSKWSEGKLLTLAYAFEQASHARREPRFLATADLTPPAL